MRIHIIATALAAALVAAPAAAGFWGDLKRGVGETVDTVAREGEKAVDAVAGTSEPDTSEPGAGATPTSPPPRPRPMVAASEPVPLVEAPAEAPVEVAAEQPAEPEGPRDNHKKHLR